MEQVGTDGKIIVRCIPIELRQNKIQVLITKEMNEGLCMSED